jgi:hypothetical protein
MARGTARTIITGLALTALLSAAVPIHAGTSASPREEPRKTAAQADDGWRWLAALWERIVQGSTRPDPPATTDGGSDISLGIDPNG